MTAGDPELVLLANAYFEGEPLAAQLGPQALRWIFRNAPPDIDVFLAPPAEERPENWQDERVGWGLILPDRADLTDEQRRTASDAPAPVHALVAARRGRVLRHSPELGSWHLRDEQGRRISTLGAPNGTGDYQLPAYLLIYGDANEIPWELQYQLNASRAVGRLCLTGEALERYVGALLADFGGAAADRGSTLVWATDNDAMTRLMRSVVAEPVAGAYARDGDIPGAAAFLGSDATVANLVGGLCASHPAVVVTASHGAIGTSANGSLVDIAGSNVDRHALAAWQPDGAIWYAHACYSAGTDSGETFTGLFPENAAIVRALRLAADAGAHVAELPDALLSASKPLKAFIGHVEPTFDWTLRDPTNGQVFAERTVKALYTRLFGGAPVGYALAATYSQLASTLAAFQQSVARYNAGEDTRARMLLADLVARDVKSTVLIGDPTVTIGMPAAGLPA